MNARELIDKLSANPTSPLDLAATSAAALPTILRALRLLDAAESNDGSTPETDAAVGELLQFDTLPDSVDADFARRLERERNGLAARVGELEAERDAFKRHAEAMADAIQFGDLSILTVAKAAADAYRAAYPKDAP